ncbi:MAG TPA: hypothetical protein VJ806_05440 [Luteimonas sp.]|nr:hypothetical protein [Luteimonas sp.]
MAKIELGKAIAPALVVSYAICLIVAGHGAVPLGLVLFIGAVDWVAAGKILGWAGMAGLLLAACVPQRPALRWVLQLVSACLLYASWFDIARRTDNESGSFLTTFIFSIPFQIVFAVAVVWLALRLWRSRSQA